MVHDNFLRKIESSQPDLELILQIMKDNCDVKINKRLLSLINNIVDYYIFRESDELKLPIIYIPACDETSQIQCEEFIALKMSLFWGNNKKTEIENYVRRYPAAVLPMGITGNRTIPYIKRWGLKKKVYKLLSESSYIHYPTVNEEKCLIYSKNLADKFEEYNSPKKYWYIHELIGSELSMGDHSEPLSLICDDEDKFYDFLDKNEGQVKFPHLFVFMTKDVDGRFSNFSMRLQLETIQEYNNDLDAGIKNVFYFVFSQKPYRLHRIYDLKRNLVERIQRAKINQSTDFISFTKDEMDYVFRRKTDDVKRIDISYLGHPDLTEFKSDVDYILQDLPYEVRLRNEMALCLSPTIANNFIEDLPSRGLESETSFFDYFFKAMGALFKEQAEKELIDFIQYRHIGVVVDYNVSNRYIKSLGNYLRYLGATNVSFWTYKDLKRRRNYDGTYSNGISNNYIILMSLLNHGTGKLWSIYPNSFDDFFIKKGQHFLIINNRFVFEPRYSWYNYRYVEQSRHLLSSDFRNKYVKNAIFLPQKPTSISEKEPKEDEDEVNVSARNWANYTTRFKFSFEGKQHRILYENDLLLCEKDGEKSIYSVDDFVKTIDNPVGLMIQPLSDLYDSLSLLANIHERVSPKGEAIIRQNPRYGLSMNEIESKVEMWKLLLKQKIKKSSEDKVYTEIMEGLLPMDRIQKNAFKSWLEDDNPAILPRNKKMQRKLLEDYLGIEPLYTRLLRHKKALKINNTEDKNKLCLAFLRHCLLSNDYKKSLLKLSDEVRDFFDIESVEDIKTIIDLISDNISLRKITKELQIL